MPSASVVIGEALDREVRRQMRVQYAEQDLLSRACLYSFGWDGLLPVPPELLR